uniref:Uncharacterized protein n=1 Tax=Brassica campestris TaxID=3711 RepID=M4DST8_BRACM
MKREFIGPSKKEPADSRTIRKSTREESIDTLQATTIDNMNQKSIDTDHLTSIYIVHPTSIYIVHPMSIDTAHQPSIDIIHLPSDTTCLEAGKDTADSTHKNIDISSCDPTSDGDRKITIDDFLELEEFLELEDGEKLEDLDSSRAVTMEDFLELEEWLEDMDHNLKKKLDDDQHTSRGDLETSKANIDRQQPDEIDRQKPHIIDLHPPDIDRHRQPIINRHHPPNIDICPLMDDPPGCIVELEHIEERMNMSKASHLDVLTHQRPPFWIEEAAGFHKRVKRIYDPMKIVVSYVVFEVESPIPPDRSMHFSSFIGGWKNHHAIRQVWGKEEEELEEEKKDQGQFSVFIDSLLLRWCQEIQSAQQMNLTSICKASSTPSC